jgi:Na+-translocating ferredoxin:NAD+ oxidoreductase RnfG subunit
MLRPGVVCCLALIAPAFVAAQTAPPKKVAESIRRVFGAGTRIDTLGLDSAAVLRISRADTLLGFAQVRNVKGKDQPITYLVAVDPEARLRDIDILVYREPYGGEVAYEPWRRQFRGKSADAPLTVGRDIQGISGATISVNAVTAGVRRAVAAFAVWRGRGLLR